MDVELIERITKLEENIKSLTGDVVEMKQLINEMHEISITLAKLTEQMHHTSSDVKEMKEDINNLKQEPSRKWNLISNTIITAIVSGIVAFIITTLK